MPAPRAPTMQVARDVLISALAIVSVAIGLHQLSLPDERPFSWLDAVDIAIVAVFWADFVMEARRVGLRPYVRRHWWELPSLIPTVPQLVAVFPGLAVVRIVRLTRLLRVVAVLMRLRPLGAYVVRLARSARLDLILAIGAGVVLLGTVFAYAIESRANERMAEWGDALWWSLNMFTNVAYVDFQPVTLGGRVLAAILQLCGIAFIGIFTASLAGAIVREPQGE